MRLRGVGIEYTVEPRLFANKRIVQKLSKNTMLIHASSNENTISSKMRRSKIIGWFIAQPNLLSVFGISLAVFVEQDDNTFGWIIHVKESAI